MGILIESPPVDARPTGAGRDLLQYRLVGALVRWPGFPTLFQATALIVFCALAILGWGKYTPEGVNSKLFAKTNLVNLVIWGLWWPAIVWVTVLLGRAWCIVCPLELVSSGAEKLGRSLGLHQRPTRGWSTRGSLALIFFALLQMLVPGVQLHRVPHYTSLFLLTSLSLAFVVGLMFKDRAFCRGLCPISPLLSAYGRGGMLAVRSLSRSGCQSDAKAPGARACPSLLNPARLNSNKDCLVCGDCVKADTGGRMQLLWRPLYSKADMREPLAPWPLTLFVMMVSGFVTYELSGVWKAAGDMFLWVPTQISMVWPMSGSAGWIQGLWTIIVWPLALWLVLGAVSMLLGGGRSLGEAWRRLALPMAVVVATGHMAKALEKFTSWIGFLPHAWAEPTGLQTALEMSTKVLPQPEPWFGLPTLSVAAMSLVALGIYLALREARLANRERREHHAPAIVLLGGFFMFLVYGWGEWWT